MMRVFQWIRMTIPVVGLLLFHNLPASGQNEFDFDLLDERIAEAEAAPRADSSTEDDDETVAPDDPAVVEASPAVDAIESSEPSKPWELMRAIDQLIRLERTDVAGPYLDQLVRLQLNDGQLSELYEAFGTAAMIRLGRASELAPQSRDFALQVISAERRTLRDSARISAWVEQLNSDDRKAQYRAAEQLLRSGAHAVPHLIIRMSRAMKPGDAVDAWSAALLERLGDDALDPAYAHLRSKNLDVRVAAIQALERVRLKESLPYLVRPLLMTTENSKEANAAAKAWQHILGRIPNRDEALSRLARESLRAYGEFSDLSSDTNDQTEQWLWDGESERAVFRTMRLRDAAAVQSAQLNGDLARLQTSDVEILERSVVSQLHVAKTFTGLDEPLDRGAGSAFNSTKQLGGDRANGILRRALRDGHDAAAIGIIEVLGDVSAPSVLQGALPGSDAEAAPLVSAMSHPNRRVRFAAAKAMMTLKPAGSFVGAGRLADVLEYFATSRGRRAAVIAHPNRSVARSVAGMLSSRGFRVAAVTTEVELQEATTQSADVELIIVSDAMNRQSIWSIIEALRAQPQTARLPIAILARRVALDEAKRVTDRQARTTVLSERIDDEGLDTQLPELIQLADRNATSAERRLEQAREAISMLALLVTSDSSVEIDMGSRYSRIVDAVGSQELVDDGLTAFRKRPSRIAQSLLVDLASQNERPLTIRRAAGEAFRASAEQYGVLLNRSQVMRQYSRYNESRSLDLETQGILSSILDSIEDPKRVGSSRE